MPSLIAGLSVANPAACSPAPQKVKGRALGTNQLSWGGGGKW